MHHKDGKLDMDGARVLFRCQASNKIYLISFPVLNESTARGGRIATRLVDNKWSSRREVKPNVTVCTE